jgi:predicted nucleotidyltransferase
MKPVASLESVKRSIDLPTKEGFITVAGSRSYGTNLPTSDYDYRGFFFPERKHVLGFRPGPDHFDWIGNGDDFFLWEIRRFAKLAMSANPNVLEALFTDPSDHVLVTPSAKTMITHKNMFLSRRIANSFVGVAIANWKKIEKSQQRGDPMIGKDAMHMVRYLVTCEEALRTGVMTIKRPAAERDHYLAIRRGEVGYNSLNDTKNELIKKIEDLEEHSALPVEPNEDYINDVLVHEMGAYLEVE